MLRLPTFRYLRPRAEGEALAAVAAEPRARFVAGGTDLWPNLKRRQEEPATVIGLGRLGSLRGIAGTPAGGVRVGALTTLTALAASPLVRAACPAAAKAASLISTPLLRNMGTIGGNLLLDTRCNYYDQSYEWRRAIDFCLKKDGEVCWVAPGSPRCWAVQSSDEAPLLAAIGARVRLASAARGERVIAVDDLYRNDGVAYLSKAADELLTEVLLPPAGRWRAAYMKVRRRGSFDFPVLGVGAWVAFDGPVDRPGAVVADVRLRLGGVGSYPVAADEARAALVGKPLTEDAIREAADLAARPSRPLDNTDFAMGWRKQVTRVYVARALRAIAAGSPGGSSDKFDGVPGLGSALPMAGPA